MQKPSFLPEFLLLRATCPICPMFISTVFSGLSAAVHLRWLANFRYAHCEGGILSLFPLWLDIIAYTASLQTQGHSVIRRPRSWYKASSHAPYPLTQAFPFGRCVNWSPGLVKCHMFPQMWRFHSSIVQQPFTLPT